MVTGNMHKSILITELCTVPGGKLNTIYKALLTRYTQSARSAEKKTCTVNGQSLSNKLHF